MNRTLLARSACVAAISVAPLAGCGSGGGSPVVSPAGHIGPLRLDVSDRAAVVAFAGRPDAEQRGEYDGYGPYEAIGYGCPGTRATNGSDFPVCATVFFLRPSTGKLEEFYTTERRYTGPGGVRVGMPAAEAASRLHRRIPTVGCISQWPFGTRDAFGAIVLEGVVLRVGFIVLVSAHHAAGVFDCIDS
jgi:hypothetical protein